MKKKIKLALMVIGLAIVTLLTLGLTSCSSPTKSDGDGVPTTNKGNITGKIRTSTSAVLENAVISTGDLTAITNSAGEFLITDIPEGQDIVVTISKDGYIATHRTINVTKNRTTHITASLFTAQVSTIAATTANDINFSFFHDGKISLPENAFVDSDGNPYTGSIIAATKYFDPTDPVQLESFPGTFSGIQEDGTEVPFESFGFINATFTAANTRGDKLQLAEGKTAEIKVPVPSALSANAPDTMPLWYFDEESGKWIEDGIGTKVGDYYIGDVTHFSYWNFDLPIVPEVQSTLTGKVYAKDSQNNDIPANNAQIVAMGVDYSGYTTAVTNSLGEYSITVKANAQVRLTAHMGSNTSVPTSAITTPAGGDTKEIDDIFITNRNFRVTGVIKDTSGEPIAETNFVLKQHNAPAGSFPFSTWLFTDEDGAFDEEAAFGSPGETVQLMFTTGHHHNRSDKGLYSNPITITIPYPGDVHNFGNVTCYPGGSVQGRAIGSDNTPFEDTWIYFMPLEAESEEDFYGALTDENGNFTISGPPNTTIQQMVGTIWIHGEGSFETDPFNLSFPASGQVTNLGNIRFNPSPDTN